MPIFEMITPYEIQISLLIQKYLSHPLLDIFFREITDLHKNYLILTPLVSLVFFVLYKNLQFDLKKTFYWFFCLLSVIGISDLTGSIVKKSLLRPRPFTYLITATNSFSTPSTNKNSVSSLNSNSTSPSSSSTPLIVQKSQAQPSKSFYSNHSSNMFALATFMMLLLPLTQYYFFAFAFLIAFSRLYNGVHFLSDIVVGAIAGAIIAKISYFIFKNLSEKLFKKKDQ